MAALRAAAPEHHKQHFNETEGPVNLKIAARLSYPDAKIIIHADPDCLGKPWHDFGWLRVDQDEDGSENDPSDPEEHRLLVKFWGFTKVRGRTYALVDYYERWAPKREPKHLVFRKYRLQMVLKHGRPVPRFYAVDIGCIVSGAVWFPDPDHSTEARPAVLYVPPFVELCGGNTLSIPPMTFLPAIRGSPVDPTAWGAPAEEAEAASSRVGT